MSEPTTCTCGCSRSRHTDDGKCHGRNADDTGTCRCTAFHEAPGDAPDVSDMIADGISNAVPGRISEHLAMGEIVESVIEELKQNGYTIAPRGDVLTATLRDDINWIISELELSQEAYGDVVPDYQIAVVSRLRELANGGAA